MKTLLIGVILSAVLGDSDVDPIEFHRQKSRDGQINPNDPFGKQLLLRKTKSQEIAIVSSGELLHKAQDQAVCDALMKHFIRDFLDHLKPHLNQNSEVDTNGCFSGKLVAELKIEPFDLQQLKQFVASPDELDTAKIWDVLQAYKRAFHLVKCAEVSELERNTPYIATILQILNVVVLLPASVMLITKFFRLRWWQLVLFFISAVFLLSFVWTWLHMYKIKQAQNLARRHAEVPKECLKAADSVSAWRSVVRWTENLFSLHRADSLCAQYYKDMMVDPFWEVAPLEAVAESLSKFFLIPLGHIGEHLGIFFRRLFAELPIQLWIPVTIAVICGFLTLLFFQRNYDFSLLYGLIRLGPPIPQPAIERRRSRSRDLSAPQLTAAVEKHGELRSRSKSQNRSNSQSRSVPANMQIIKPVEIEQTGTLTEQSD